MSVCTGKIQVQLPFLIVPVAILLLLSFFSAQNFESSLRCLNQSDSLEGASMRVQIYLAMNRVDLAKYGILWDS